MKKLIIFLSFLLITGFVNAGSMYGPEMLFEVSINETFSFEDGEGKTHNPKIDTINEEGVAIEWIEGYVSDPVLAGETDTRSSHFEIYVKEINLETKKATIRIMPYPEGYAKHDCDYTGEQKIYCVFYEEDGRNIKLDHPEKWPLLEIGMVETENDFVYVTHHSNEGDEEETFKLEEEGEYKKLKRMEIRLSEILRASEIEWLQGAIFEINDLTYNKENIFEGKELRDFRIEENKIYFNTWGTYTDFYLDGEKIVVGTRSTIGSTIHNIPCPGGKLLEAKYVNKEGKTLKTKIDISDIDCLDEEKLVTKDLVDEKNTLEEERILEENKEKREEEIKREEERAKEDVRIERARTGDLLLEEKCEDDNECLSNYCDKTCGESGFFKKIKRWFRNVFWR